MNDSRHQQEQRMWAIPGRDAGRLSVLDLIRNETLNVRTAAILWLLIEKTSLIVAAGPQHAGKTTLLTALVDLLPPSREKVYTRGVDEDFSFAGTSVPSDTLILVPEFSDHTPAYLWGGGVRRLFDLLETGYSVGGTMHAETSEEALAEFAGIGVPPAQLHQVGAIVNIRVEPGPRGDIDRRVSRPTLVEPGPRLITLARLDNSDGDVPAESPELEQGLADHLDMPRREVGAQIEVRSKALEDWLSMGPLDLDELEVLVARHHRPT